MTQQTAEPAWIRALEDEQATIDLAAVFSAEIEAPLAVYLRGDLGAGKTTFVRAYIHALGYQGYVKSPSYGLLETYRLDRQSVLHLDLYRIEDPEELEFLALRDLYTASTVLMVEWPDRGRNYLPQADLLLKLGEKDEARFAACFAFTERGEEVANRVAGHF